MTIPSNASDLKEFKKQTEKLDTIRHEDFNTIFPELVQFKDTN